MKRLCHLCSAAVFLLTTVVTVVAAQEIAIGKQLPDVTMHGLNGPAKRLTDFHGTPLVINIWASWCGPCRQEMGSLERLFWRFGGRQLNVIGISTDDYPHKAEDFLKRSNTTFSNYIDQNLRLEQLFGANRIPLTILVDAQGRISGKYYGAKEWDSPESLSLLSKKLGVSLIP